MTDEVVERVAAAFEAGFYATLTSEADRATINGIKAALAALQPGDDLGRGMVVVDFIGEYRSENERLRQLLKDARQAAEVTREACAELAWREGYKALPDKIRNLDITKIVEGGE